MTQILIGGDHTKRQQLDRWLHAWGLPSATLGARIHPAAVPATEASAVIYACGPAAPPLPADPGPVPLAAPLVLVGEDKLASLDGRAWTRIGDPGPDGAGLAAALRPCLELTRRGDANGPGFRDFLNHELRTPLTAAGTAMQTLALQLGRAGGPSPDLLDLALRNLRRLEQTVDWACEYLAGEPAHEARPEGEAVRLTDLLEDLDELTAPIPLTWATGVGDWDAPAGIERERWRRLLRQVLRAVGYQAPGQEVHLELSTLGADVEEPGLLLVFRLGPLADTGQVQRTAAQDEAEQLRHLLAFTVNPDLARRLRLRFDVVQLADQLRLRVLLPTAATPAMQLA
jgi:hypothetical protein